MFYTNGIEVPGWHPIETYKIGGGMGLAMDLFVLIFLSFVIFTMSLYLLSGSVVEYYVYEKGKSALVRRWRRVLVNVGLLLVSLGVPMFIIISCGGGLMKAQQSVVLEHYNAQVPKNTSMTMPKQEEHTVINNVLVTEEDGTVTSYATLYAIMDKDGLVSLNVNEGTEQALSLVPLDQVKQ